MIFESLLMAAIILSVAAVERKDLIHSVILLAGAELLIAILFLMLQAPDIAITQASVVAGLSSAIYILAIYKTRRME